MRIMRFSLDALVLGQVVTMALFFVLKLGRNGGACAVSYISGLESHDLISLFRLSFPSLS